MEKITREKLLSDIMVSSFRIDILSSLSGTIHGLPLQGLLQQEKGIQQHLKEGEIRSRLTRNLEKLVDDGVVTTHGSNYLLTKQGKDIYKIVQDIAAQASKNKLI